MNFKMRRVDVPGYEVTLPNYDIKGSVDEVVLTLSMVTQDESCTEDDRSAAEILLKIVKENNGK